MKHRLFLWSIVAYHYSVPVNLFLKRNAPPRIYKVIRPLVMVYTMMMFVIKRSYEFLVGRFVVAMQLRKDEQKTFQDEVSIVAIAKNEASYIEEWVAYHKLIGVDRIYIYDNDSEDNLHQVLEPYIKEGMVVYTPFPGKAQQIPAYIDGLKRLKEKSRYVAFIDCDEFLQILDDSKDIKECLHTLFHLRPNVTGIGVNWAVFGSGHQEKRTEGMVIERFLYRSNNEYPGNAHIKTIVNPRFTTVPISPHFSLYKLGGVCCSTDNKRLYAWFADHDKYTRLRLNHYYCKSKEEYLKKRQRGLADRLGEYDATMQKFYKNDLNDVYDDSMLVYARQLKKKNQ